MKTLEVFRASCEQWYTSWRGTRNIYARRAVYAALLSRHPHQMIQRHIEWIRAILNHHEIEIRNQSPIRKTDQ